MHKRAFDDDEILLGQAVGSTKSDLNDCSQLLGDNLSQVVLPTVPDKLSPMDNWIVELPMDLGTNPHRLLLIETAPAQTSLQRDPKRRKVAEDIKQSRWQLVNQSTGASYPIAGRFVAKMFIREGDQRNQDSVTSALFCAMDSLDMVLIVLNRMHSDPDAGLHLYRLELSLIDRFVIDLVMGRHMEETLVRCEKLRSVVPLVREKPLLQPMSNFSEPPFAQKLDGFKLELWDWQKRNISFLRRIEGDPSNQSIKLSDNDLSKPLPIRVGQSNVRVLPWSGKVKLNDESPVAHRAGMGIDCRGGIFCDPTSTGKSITVIASIWAQKIASQGFYDYYAKAMPKVDQARYFKSRATLIICPSRLLKQWEGYFRMCLGDRCVVLENRKKLPKTSDPDRLLIKSCSTVKDFAKLDLHTVTQVLDVILVPLSLLTGQTYCRRYDAPHNIEGKAHYVSELAKLNSLLRSKPSGSMSREDIREEISVLESVHVYSQTWNAQSMFRVFNTVANVRAAMLRVPEPVSPHDIHGVPFEAIFWPRRIVDEAHELLAGTKRAEAVMSIKANYTWLLTATPSFDLRQSSGRACLPLLLGVQTVSLAGVRDDDGVRILTEPWAMDAFLTTWCRRSGAIAKKPLTEHTIEVTLTPKELALYHSYQNSSLAHMLQFCSYHNELHSGPREDGGKVFTVSQTAEQLQVERRDRQDEIQKELRAIEQRLPQSWTYVERQLERYAPEFLPKMMEHVENKGRLVSFMETQFAEHQQLKSELGPAISSLSQVLSQHRGASSKLASVIRQQAYYESIMALLSNPADLQCAICLGTIPMEKTSLLVCGHCFCESCLNSFWGGRPDVSCPCCRQPLKRKRDIRIVDRRPPVVEEKVSEKAGEGQVELADRFGSKIKRLVELIREIEADKAQGKILVFAQWDHLLNQIGEALKLLGIQAACPRGSVAQINSAFGQFYADDRVKVLLLSTRHNLSGSHLVEANNLIFVHPFPEAPKNALLEWEQAVSRMQRYGQKRDLRVWYLVTNNTVEVELLRMFQQHKSEQHAAMEKLARVTAADDTDE